MRISEVSVAELTGRGLAPRQAAEFVQKLGTLDLRMPPERVWQWITRHLLRPEHPLPVHSYLHESVFAGWDPANGPAPAWIPEDPGSSNIAWLMRRAGVERYRDLHAWSVTHQEDFLATMIERLAVRFHHPFTRCVDLTGGPEHPRWLVNAQLNIVDSCFQAADDSPAVLHQAGNGPLESMSVAALRTLTARVAHGLAGLGLQPGDRVAIDMPLTVESVAIFLGAIAGGFCVVTVADSFAPPEIAVRLKIGVPRCVFTQDYSLRRGERLPLYAKLCAAEAPQAVVVPCGGAVDCALRAGDLTWQEFLSDRTHLETASCAPAQSSTILFSSGTTGEPKAIPWDHTTPLKCAMDAHLHQDVHPGDVLCWPTNMGWMMGPWLVYAALVNKATIALFDGAPATREFGRFVQNARVTLLGLVPSLVSAWRATGCLDGLDWSAIRAFSSTGECSNPQDMLYLMSRAGYKPVIEYCGGTEIGGGFVTGTVVQHAAPATFSTPALGCDLVILDERGQPADRGELFLIPPVLGYSRELLNGDHHAVYYAGTPTGPQGQMLRRHGDEMQRFANGYLRAHGRVDDTMNLGGIKASSLQIEEIARGVAGVRETAAIAVTPAGGGPSQLVLYAVPAGEEVLDATGLAAAIQQAIRTKLNPLFKLHEVVLVPSLPRTASNKVMRRKLRQEYEQRTEQGDTAP